MLLMRCEISGGLLVQIKTESSHLYFVFFSLLFCKVSTASISNQPVLLSLFSLPPETEVSFTTTFLDLLLPKVFCGGKIHEKTIVVPLKNN